MWAADTAFRYVSIEHLKLGFWPGNLQTLTLSPDCLADNISLEHAYGDTDQFVG